eukprot:scaffold20539_cov66-Phaeocystis_antarctica.AAC.2
MDVGLCTSPGGGRCIPCRSMMPPLLASPSPSPSPRPPPARRSLQSPERWMPVAPPQVLSRRATDRQVPPRAPPRWGADPWVVEPPARSSIGRPFLRGIAGTRALPKRGVAAPWTGRLGWMEPRLCWTELRMASRARPPTLRPSAQVGGGAVDLPCTAPLKLPVPWPDLPDSLDLRSELDGGPGGIEAGGESVGAGAPLSLESAAAYGTAIVTVVERAATALELVIVQQALLLGQQLLHALLQPHLLLLPLHVAVAQVHLGQVRHDEANDEHAPADPRNLLAEGDRQEDVEQHEAYQPKLVPEPQAVGAVHQRAHHAPYGPFVLQRHGPTCLSLALDVRDNVNDHDQHQYRCPGPRAQALATHRVVHAVD